MIRLIEALNFRCLRYISQPLKEFHVLVGPNGSGKTTFLDVPSFLSDILNDGLETAWKKRTSVFQKIIWNHNAESFELAIELSIPKDRIPSPKGYDRVRYEIQIGPPSGNGEIHILAERVLLKMAGNQPGAAQEVFPFSREPPATILCSPKPRDTKTIVNKTANSDNFHNETAKKWDHSFYLGPKKSALANLPEDESAFPVTVWLKKVLQNGIQELMLNSSLMRRPSPPNQPAGFRPDGSNLPWVIEELKGTPDKFAEWLLHLRSALPDIVDIKTFERPEDLHRYLIVGYRNGIEVPSWLVSDGTLRLLALTILAYLPVKDQIFLIEEPENGIHPSAVETVFQSLSSVYHSQVLVATHSPVILSAAKSEDVLCFAKTGDGVTDIVSGDHHPALKNWKGATNLGVLFASGVLG